MHVLPHMQGQPAPSALFSTTCGVTCRRQHVYVGAKGTHPGQMHCHVFHATAAAGWSYGQQEPTLLPRHVPQRRQLRLLLHLHVREVHHMQESWGDMARHQNRRWQAAAAAMAAVALMAQQQLPPPQRLLQLQQLLLLLRILPAWPSPLQLQPAPVSYCCCHHPLSWRRRQWCWQHHIPLAAPSAAGMVLS